MSAAYDSFLKKHFDGIRKGYYWFSEHISHVLDDGDFDYNLHEYTFLYNHDASKLEPLEYGAYDAYFYSGEMTNDISETFQYAWLNHIHLNPHHWQHWVLINDEDGIVAKAMPYRYIVEMILDWWSFSWNSGDLNTIFKWYDDHKERIMLHYQTRATVERILSEMKETIFELNVGQTLLKYTDEYKDHFNTKAT